MVIFMTINRLTDKQVSTAQPSLRKKDPKNNKDFVETALSDGGGLYLVIKARGTKSWMFLYTSKLTGKQEKLGLGGYPNVSLQIARRLATAERERLALGTDPKAAKDEHKAEIQRERDKERFTFKQLADAWRVESRKDRNWSEGHDSRQYALLVNHVFPYVGGKYIVDISEPEIVDLLRRVWDSDKKETSMRVRGIVRAVYSYGCGVGALPNTSDFMRFSDNVGRLKKPRVRSFAALIDPGDVGKLMRDIRGYEGRGPIVKAALNLLPLLAQRQGQFRRMRWEDTDLEGWLWTCPPQIMKISQEDKDDPRTRPHLVPLPRQAVDILTELKPITGATGTGLVFPSPTKKGQPISENSLGSALRALGYNTQTQITPHGFRTVMQTLTQEALNLPKAWSDRHLAHKPSGPLSDRYDRAQFLYQRFDMVQKYADYLDYLADTAGPGAPHPEINVRQAGKVVSIKRHAA